MEDEYEYEEEEEEEEFNHGGKSGKKRTRSDYIDDLAEEDDEDEDEYEEEDEEEYGRKRKKRGGRSFIDDEADVDSNDEEEEEEEGEDGFIDNETELRDYDSRPMHRRPLLPREDQEEEDFEALERSIQARYAKSSHTEYEDEETNVDQQALLPSVRDPKLWMVKCAIGHEREVAVCLMQKCIDKGPELQIRSVVALDHLKNFIYIEADKEAHVREACKGMRNIYPAKLMLVPIKEMTDVLSVESKAVDLARDTWVRMKTGNYKGDLAKVVDVDNVRQKVTVKLIPRIDLQALANKLDGRDVPKKKAFVPPPRLMNIDEAREMNIRVERRKDSITGHYFENIGGMMFKDGFYYKTVAMKSISTHNIQPSFDEIEKFSQPDGSEGSDDTSSLSNLFANRKKGHFMKGDRVIVVKGDLKNLQGWVEKVEEDTVHIRPNEKNLPQTLAVGDKELCKYFEPGNHVKVVSGASEGATGMVVSVEGHLVNLVSDTTKELICVFADAVVESSEVTSGATRIGEYELHDLVLLSNRSFGVIIRVECEAFQVLKGVPEKAEVALVRLREIRGKVDKKWSAHDKYHNALSVKDVVKVLEGPCKGKQGPVEHIYRGVVFIYDRHHLEHAGFICARVEYCVLIGGSRDKRGDPFSSRFGNLRIPPRPNRGGPPRNFGGGGRGRGGHDALIGTTVNIRLGPFKGCKGRVVNVKGTSVRVELEAQMKVVTVERGSIMDINVRTPPSRYGSGSETPLHPSRTPLHPFMTPMRDLGPGATPIHDGMRTPMRDRAWNPMSPPRDSWEDGNPGSWGSSPRYEAPTPGSAFNNSSTGSYSDAGTPGYGNAPSPYMPSTPGGPPPMTPSSAYLPGTPGGQPMTPGSLDMMSPVAGGEGDGPWFLPDIVVNIRRPGEESLVGVIRDVHVDGTCSVALGSSGNGEVVMAGPGEIEIVVPKKSDRVKIMGGAQRGAVGKLIGVDGTDGIVKVDDTLEVKIFDVVILAKLAL